ncbi:MAG: Uma2 family endonuclease [Isosphaeraceae bacterium]
MSVTLEERTCTPEDLLAMEDAKIYELDDGRLVRRETSMRSSWVGGRLHSFLAMYVDQNKLGWVWPSDLGYVCIPGAPRTVRRADVSFIRSGRLPGGLASDAGYCVIAPDVAVEVVSPKEPAYRLQKKVNEYIAAGVQLVWVIYPQTRMALVYRRDGSVTWLREDDELSGEDIIPGFRCRVASILPEKPIVQSTPA